MTEITDPIDDLLRRANPFAPDEPLDPALAARVVARVGKERAMPAAQNRPPIRLSRGRVLGATLATAAAGALAIGIVVLVGDDPSSGPSVALGGGGATASCLPFTPESLAMFPVAFDGRVSAIDGDRVTFEVETWFRGGDRDRVTVTAPDLVPSSAALVGGVGFEEGERYLVSGDDQGGRIVPAVCGFTLTYSEEAADTFRQAFTS